MKWKTERLPLLHGTLANTDHIYAIKSQFVYTRSFANTFSRPTHEMLWKYYFNVDTLKLCWVAGKLTGRNRKLYILKKGIIYSHFASKFVLQTKPKRLPYRKIFEHEHRKRPNKLISISPGVVTFRRITTRTLFNLLLFFFAVSSVIGNCSIWRAGRSVSSEIRSVEFSLPPRIALLLFWKFFTTWKYHLKIWKVLSPSKFLNGSNWK